MKSANGVPNKIQLGKTTPRLFTTSTLRLFKGLPITENKKLKASAALTRATLNHGFMFSSSVVGNYTDSELLELVEVVDEEIGLTPEQMNASFHKSWTKVRDAPIFQLVLEQLIHYITTYGFEAIGVFDNNTVYVPAEKLKIPEIKDGVRISIINGYTKAEIKSKLFTILGSGIALKGETINDVVTVINGLKPLIKKNELDEIKNKEVTTILYDKLGQVPANPIELLRLAIYKKTGKTLLIINKQTIKEIKEGAMWAEEIFEEYANQYGLERLAEIFLRFKPLFLAFKSEGKLKPTINKLRKLAVKNHKPMHEDYLNSVTARIGRGETLDLIVLQEELAKVNTFRKIRLAYSLGYRLTGAESILYKVRNGKGYATALGPTKKKGIKIAYEIVTQSIINDLSKNVKGKTFYIPKDIVYALPATEKQFIGNLPSGSYVSVPKDMLVGIYWENVNGQRIDIDLSLMSKDNKFGWDRFWRSDSGDILFSGDMTDARNGASELFYLKSARAGSYLLYANFFNYGDMTVPFKILVAKETAKDFKLNYMVNQNNVLCVAKTSVTGDLKQKLLGIVDVDTDGCKFYFNETSIGEGRTARNTEYSEHARQYLINYTQNAISLNDLLKLAGVRIITEKEKGAVDLSPEAVSKDSFIQLLV